MARALRYRRGSLVYVQILRARNHAGIARPTLPSLIEVLPGFDELHVIGATVPASHILRPSSSRSV